MTKLTFLQKVKVARVPMREAAVDALLLTWVILICLLMTGVLTTYPWLILLISVLAYLLTVSLRLRQAARQTTEPKSIYNYLFH